MEIGANITFDCWDEVESKHLGSDRIEYEEIKLTSEDRGREEEEENSVSSSSFSSSFIILIYMIPRSKNFNVPSLVLVLATVIKCCDK